MITFQSGCIHSWTGFDVRISNPPSHILFLYFLKPAVWLDVPERVVYQTNQKG